MNGKAKSKEKMGNTIIVHGFSLQFLHLRREREMIVHRNPLSPLPCTSLDPNYGYPLTSFLFNSGTSP